MNQFLNPGILLFLAMIVAFFWMALVSWPRSVENQTYKHDLHRLGAASSPYLKAVEKPAELPGRLAGITGINVRREERVRQEAVARRQEALLTPSRGSRQIEKRG